MFRSGDVEFPGPREEWAHRSGFRQPIKGRLIWSFLLIEESALRLSSRPPDIALAGGAAVADNKVIMKYLIDSGAASICSLGALIG